MPIYDFKCNSCYNVWDEIWNIKDYDKNILEINENKKQCPNCLKNNISRIFYPTNIKFTGEAGHSGFYALDYKLKQKKIDERKKSL